MTIVCVLITPGVQLFEGVCVESVEVENGRVAGVKTDHGDINCEIFVNCAGQVSVDKGTVNHGKFHFTIRVLLTFSCILLIS